MGCYIKFTLRVPKNNIDNYKKYILKRIYGLTDDDLLILTGGGSTNSHITLLEETATHYVITFSASTHTTIVNVLPDTLVTPGKIFYDNEQVLKEIKHRISASIQAVHDQLGECYLDYPNLSQRTFLIAIKQLATDGIIHKYFWINNRTFICSYDKFPFLIYLYEDSDLMIEILDNAIFDVDDGFTAPKAYGPSSFKEKLTIDLNNYYKQWKENGDITAHILPINDLR